MNRYTSLRLAIVFLLAMGSTAQAAEPAPVDYTRDIKPLFARHCTECHGVKKQESGLRLDTARTAIAGGDSGAAILAGKSAESLLVQAITGAGDVEKMPPEGLGLSAEQIALIKRWIDEGAKSPADEVAEIAGAKHWAFKRPLRPTIPVVKNDSWPRTPIDFFILARLERDRLTYSPEAERETLIRRVSLDLLGLPPAPDEVRDFVSDSRPDAYERLVERLLASPAYGERWGRHWLDLARYADSNGYTRDFGREIWKYREWVVEAINRDLPFDQFTIEQLAGDMLPSASQDQLVATGFHRNTLTNEEGGTDPEQFRIESVADRVATTGSVFLGLTIGCARCHSHKYDPISHREYYQFFAFLNNCDEPSVEAPSALHIERGDLERRAEIRANVKKLEDELEGQRPELEAKQQEWEKSVTPEQRARLPGPVQVAYDMAFDKRDMANKKLVEEFFKKTDLAKQAFPLIAKINELKEAEPKIPSTLVMRERSEPRETFVHKRGDFLDKGPRVRPGVPAVLHSLSPGIENPTRLDMARWLVDPANPLTPRVTMNRHWIHFFGRGLVETEDDFGLQGAPPSHPELLDWLAIEFVEQGYSLKAMHRWLVTSAVYRQSSKARADLAEKDPRNLLLGRQNRLRLDAEVVRDSSLAAAGLLTRALGGPSVFPPQPPGVFDFTQDVKTWNAAVGADRYRRGMYTHFWRSSPYPALMVFDAPNGNVTCTRRVRSNTPLQSLTLANDLAYVECAQALARRALTEAPDEAPCHTVDRLFEICFAREPESKERHRLLEFYNIQQRAFAKDKQAAEALAGTNLPVGQTAQKIAAWTTVARVLLNLDEFITRE